MIPIIWREFKTLTTSFFSLILNFVTPIFLLIFFATVLSKNLTTFNYNGMPIQYLDFFTPGLVGYITFMTFQMALTFIRHDRMSGMLGIIVLSQGNMMGYISGKLVAQIIVNLIKVLLIITLSIMISKGNIELLNLENIFLFVVSIVLGSSIWLCIGLSIALLLNRDDVREVLVMIISMPLIFASSMYYDISKAPDWIKTISLFNPLTYTCNLARKAYLLENISNYSFDIIILLSMFFVSLILTVIISRIIEL